MPDLNKNLVPILLILASAGVIFFFIVPKYNEIQTLRDSTTVYQTAIDNANQVRILRNNLLANYNGVSDADKKKLSILLPDKINSPKFMHEFVSLASDFGIKLGNFSVGDTSSGTETSAQGSPTGPQPVGTAPDGGISPANYDSGQNYGTVVVNASFNSDYGNFLNYLAALESSLQLYDVVSISLSTPGASANNGNSSGGGSNQAVARAENYGFGLVLNTYWFKK